MIYELPLPYRAVDYLGPAWDDAKMQTVLNYLESVATNAGYIVGPGGFTYSPRGTVLLDLDREPDREAWMNINPQQPQIDADKQLALTAKTYLAGLDAGTLPVRDVMRAVAWLIRNHPTIQELENG